MTLGVPGDPSANQDVSTGTQSAGQGPSTPSEGTSSVNQSSAQPSGLRDQAVPYDRFRDVNEKRKEAEQRAQELERQLQQLQTSAPRQPDFNQAIEEATARLGAALESGDAMKAARIQAEIARMEAQSIADAKVREFQGQMQQAQSEQEMAQRRAQYWNRAVQDYGPEVANPDSPLYKAALEIWSNDEDLQGSLSGEYDAVARAVAQMSRGGGQGRQQAPRMETGGAVPPSPNSPEGQPSVKDQYLKEKEAFFQNPSMGNLEAMLSRWGNKPIR